MHTHAMPKGHVYGKHAETPRTFRLHIRLTEQEHLNLLAIAENSGKTVSDLIRSTVAQITSHSRRVRALLVPAQFRPSLPHALRCRLFRELERNGNGKNATGNDHLNLRKTARVSVSREISYARESAISRKTGHANSCKCVECENLRSLFRFADGRPQAKQPKRRTPKLLE